MAAKGASTYIVDVSIKSGKITVSPDPVIVEGKNAKLKWKITTPGWIFPEFEEGIELKCGSGGEFSNGHRSETDPAEYTLHDKNAVKRQHLYVVSVMKEDGSFPMYLDPTIGNEG
jgi:hypothetical protein